MKIIFAGTPQNAAQALEKLAKTHEICLVITREDAPVGRRRELTPSAVAKVASDLGVPVLKANRIGSEQIAEIAAAEADLALVIAYGAMIPQSALDLLDWWNLHFSLLPMWRGATPLQHSILHGTEAGITLFKLDRGLDTGEIVAQKRLELDPNESTLDALPRFTNEGVDLFESAISMPVKLTEQQGVPSYAPKLSRADARLDFSKSADELHRVVMAFNPEPMAWCEFNGLPIRIIDTRSLGTTNWISGSLQPGRVAVSSGKILLECHGGTQLEIKRLQPSGKNAMDAQDWIRGISGEVNFV